MIVDRYLYGRLPEKEKIIYREIYEGCVAHRDIIPITSTEDEIVKSYERIVTAVMDDNPLLYFVNQSTMDFAKDINGNIAVIPQYYFSTENVSAYHKKIQDAVNKLIQELQLTEGTDLDKVRKVHDYMCTNISYDYDGSDIKDLGRFIAAHSIIGVFAHKKSMCEGIAKAVKVLLNAVDVKCIFLSGMVKRQGDEMEAHGWNIVNIEGAPYQLDITLDIGAGSADFISYDYYNITDAQMRRNHIMQTGYPKCSATELNYFVQNNLVFSSKKKLQEYITAQAETGQMMFYFKLSGKLKAKELCDEMANVAYQVFCNNGQENVKAYHVVNDYMNTGRIYFK